MNRSAPLARQLLLCITLALGLGACQSLYFRAQEALGNPKRDILVSRVEKAQASQSEAKEQFRDALEQFRAVARTPDTPLSRKYDTLRAELDRSEARAKEVRDRIDAVEDVSKALFREWEAELDQYSDPGLRRSSETRLRETQRRYERLMAAMRRAEARMEPVLRPFRDQVLYLKHNLNAQAFAALEDELREIEVDVEALIREMESSIAEADAFLSGME